MRHAPAAAPRVCAELQRRAMCVILGAMDDHLDPKLRAKIQEAVDEANEHIRAKRFRSPDEAIAYIQYWLGRHAPLEVLEWQEQERRRLMVN